MKLWILAGLFSAVAIPWASASETLTECGLDTRQIVRHETPANAETPRRTRKAARVLREEAANASVGQIAAPRLEQRRPGGSLRRIPDAMLIDGRGAL